MSKIIVALDVPSESKAQEIVDTLGERITFYKVGLQLLTAAGPEFIKKLVRARKNVFLDLKLFEIPNSVKSAVLAAGDLGVSMVTVHAMGGEKIMEAAVNAALTFPNMQVLALTVVTSMTNEDLKKIGISNSCEEQVLRLAILAKESGCQGLVASPAELISLRKVMKEMTLVAPGIRLTVDPQDSRSDTPRAALKNGADYIVMGRSIIESANPSLLIQQITAEF